MAKYEVGDRVRSLVNEPSIGVKVGTEGNILDITNNSFHVSWDMNGGNEKWWIYKEGVELVRLVDPVFVIKRENSWDDSVEFTPTEMPKIDRFTFGYEDDYGMETVHVYSGKEFEYSLVDIVANFTLFLRGVGYTDEEIGEFINEGNL